MLSLPPRPGAVDDSRRRGHDVHSLVVVLSVLAVILLYVYAFTRAGSMAGLPLPQDLAESAGLRLADVFDDDRNVAHSIWMPQAREFKDTDEEMLAFFLMLSAVFVCVYFLPVRLKRDALSLATALMLGALYGWPSLAWFLLAHLATYLVLHPDRRERPWTAALPGFAAAFLLQGKLLPLWLLLLVWPAAAYLAYQHLVRPLAVHPRLGPVMRVCAAQSFLAAALAGVLLNGLAHADWSFGFKGTLPLGLIVFFGQWLRLIPYHLDQENGLVPQDLPLRRYLANFLCPAILPQSLYEIVSQGYAYTEAVYLCEQKNKIAMGGVKLLLIALFYMVFGDWISYRLADAAGLLGIEAYRASIRTLSMSYLEGLRVTTSSVLVTSVLELVRFSFWWAAISHFKVGVWRIFGFRVDPHYHYWPASTNLIELWGRSTFHYREFLVRAFYYPVFFRLSRFSAAVRIAAATFAAAGLGNFIWGHALERFFYQEMSLSYFAPRWPYFVLLSAGIALTQLYQMSRRNRRRPWTWGPGIAWDVACACVTIQFYSLIHVFSLPPKDVNVTLWELCKIFLLGFGVRL